VPLQQASGTTLVLCVLNPVHASHNGMSGAKIYAIAHTGAYHAFGMHHYQVCDVLTVLHLIVL
jgi:hypothetical protein